MCDVSLFCKKPPLSPINFFPAIFVKLFLGFGRQCLILIIPFWELVHQTTLLRVKLSCQHRYLREKHSPRAFSFCPCCYSVRENVFASCKFFLFAAFSSSADKSVRKNLQNYILCPINHLIIDFYQRLMTNSHDLG